MDTKTIHTLYKAIPLRHSFRNFHPAPLPEDVLTDLKAFGIAMSLPFEGAERFCFFTAECGKKLYNNGINPPTNLAIFSQTDLVSLSKAGFAGELMILRGVSAGLTTCWFGHYRLAELGRYLEGIASPERLKESTLGYGYGRGVDVGERVVACIPLGYPQTERKRLIDRLAERVGSGRKPLEALLEKGTKPEDIPDNIREVFRLGSLAPSAANSQMWRFGFREGRITVAKPVGYRHLKWEHPDIDVGCCAAHIWLGLREKGITSQVDVVRKEDRAFWEFTF